MYYMCIFPWPNILVSYLPNFIYGIRSFSKKTWSHSNMFYGIWMWMMTFNVSDNTWKAIEIFHKSKFGAKNEQDFIKSFFEVEQVPYNFWLRWKKLVNHVPSNHSETWAFSILSIHPEDTEAGETVRRQKVLDEGASNAQKCFPHEPIRAWF